METIGALAWRVLKQAHRARKGQVTCADRREPASEVTVGNGVTLLVPTKQEQGFEPSPLSARIKPDDGRRLPGE